MATIQTVAVTLSRLATPGITRKDLVGAVRAQHPEASKKDIVRAAFYALTEGSNGDSDRTTRLHAFALAERANEETEPSAPGKRRKKTKRKSATGVRATAN